jgi:hypothetical protein
MSAPITYRKHIPDQPHKVLRHMDRLKLCMDALRALALQSANTNSYPLAEREITQYLQSPGALVQKLREAIDREAETSQHYSTFWATMQEFVSTRIG